MVVAKRIDGIVALAGINPEDNTQRAVTTVLAAAVDADGIPHLLEVDAAGALITSGGGGGGGVTSVGLTVPSIFSVSGSPVTTSGTLDVSLTTQAANLGLFGPASGVAAIPTFRSLVEADLGTGAGTTGKFLRGDMVWSNTLLDTLVVGSGTTAQITFGGSSTLLLDGAADKVAIRNGLIGQALYIYNTWSEAGANYERGILGWSGNVFTVGVQPSAGTGAGRTMMLQGGLRIEIAPAGSVVRWEITGAAILPIHSNTYDFGSTSKRLKTIYAGTSVVSPAFILDTQQDYTVTNSSVDRAFDADATSIDELADVLGTLIGDLVTAGLLQ